MVQVSPSSLTFEVEGTPHVVAEIAEQIIWLAAIMRCADKDTITYCTPYLKNITLSTSKQRLAQVGFITSTEVADQGFNGTCWHPMFRNPIVVRGYPIRRRSGDQMGLEIPLNIAARLMQSAHVTEFLGKSYIKGFSSMLVAVGQADNDEVCLWHHFYNPAGGRISYLDSSKTSTGSITADKLAKGRHIVGWCNQVSIQAGKLNNTHPGF